MNTEVRHLTKDELAKRLNVSKRQLDIWHDKGEGPVATQLGPRMRRYRLEDVEAYEAKCRAVPKQP